MSKKILTSSLEQLQSEKVCLCAHSKTLSCSRIKVKDRNEAIEKLRSFISSNQNVLSLPTKQWTEVINSICDAANTARTKLDTKSTPAAERRLIDVAALLRTFVERAAIHLPRKAVKKFLDQVGSQLITRSRRGVFKPLAIEYFKALRAVLAHRPHLEHLEEAQWTDVVKISFAAALRDSVQLTKDCWGDDETESRVYLEQDPEDALNVAINPGQTPDGKQQIDKLCTTQELFEIFSVLAHLFISPNANIAIVKNPAPFLSRLLRSFQVLTVVSPLTESTTHLPLLQALNALLCQIGVNDYWSMIKFAPRVWHHLIRLRSSKSIQTKEHVVSALYRLAPYVLSGKQKESSANQCATSLWEAILAEPDNRMRVEDLKLASLELVTPSSRLRVNTPGRNRLFNLKTVRAPLAGFTSHQAITWSIHELGAQCLGCLYEASEDVITLSPAPESSRASKRTKVSYFLIHFQS